MTQQNDLVVNTSTVARHSIAEAIAKLRVRDYRRHGPGHPARQQHARQHYIGDYDRIRDTMACVLDGFEDFNTRVRHPHGFRIRQLARERVFQTPSGRAESLLRRCLTTSTRAKAACY